MLEDLRDGHQEDYIKDLNARINETEILIAQLEHRIEDDRVVKERQDRELNKLRPEYNRLKEIEDEYKVMKIENESLTKKANMVDNFNKKLEHLSNTEKEYAKLRNYADTLETNLREYDRIHDKNERLLKEKGENASIIANLEREINDLTRQKDAYKEDARAKQNKIDNLEAVKASDEAFIADLHQQIKTGNHAPISPNSPGSGERTLTLEEELANAPEPTPNYPLEISRLRAEISLLKSASAGTTNATLQIDLDDANRKNERLSQNLKEITDKNAVMNNQLSAMLSSSSTDKYVQLGINEALKAGPLQLLTNDYYRDKAIAISRDLERKAIEELTTTKAKLADTQSELTSQYRELLQVKADCTSPPKLAHLCVN